MDTSALMEAFRRRAGQQPSTAGMSGANLNPQAGTPQRVMQSPLGQAPKPSQPMSQPGIKQLGQSMPGEAQLILKALISRLKQNPPTA